MSVPLELMYDMQDSLLFFPCSPLLLVLFFLFYFFLSFLPIPLPHLLPH